ncbi:hypothetical protein BOTBODRAFT_28953 [Botryobasidium botryosum FD-172 SS1]|uniref:Metallo-beta-lactamase domain-containing protein n=1 Tax=Botryobasidium botryosum (strain FD-172 SS1) TaxID=930990 RepID=A0A067MS40_BOTB1|nr:hypothetical protein BOTBODRAFT_28953 [Botryobasidium botryosum FD-172 SS1]
MQKLESIVKLSNRVYRVLGQNPGEFTLQGTNTYIIGSKPPFILLDTGEGREAYIPLLKQALQEASGFDASVGRSRPLVSDIVISHRHYDHHCGLPSVLNLLHQLWSEGSSVDSGSYTPPRVHKFPLSADHPPEPSLQKTLTELAPGTFRPTPSGSPLHDLHDLQALSAPDSSLLVVHTPGHTADSVCVYLREERVLFTADTVLGQGTAVFEDLGTYIVSLRRLVGSVSGGDGGDGGSGLEISPDTLFPGHGPVVENGRKVIETYIQHRQEREDQIVRLLSTAQLGDAEATWTVQAIVANLYAAYPKAVWPAAGRGILLHLAKLESEGKVKKRGGQDGDPASLEWELIARL